MANVAVMEREIDNLRRQMDDLRAIQSRSRMMMIMFIVLMVVMFAVFLVATSARIRDNFTREAVNKAVAENSQVLVPQLSREMQNAVADVLPVYRDLAIERFRQVGPEVAQDAITRFRELPKESYDAMRGRLDASIGRIVANASPDLHQLLAQLPDEREQVLIDAMHKRLVEDVTKRGETLADQQVTRLQNILAKFDVSAKSVAKSPEDLERDFVHGLLMMADYELMFGGDDEFIEAPPKIKPPLAPAAEKKVAEKSTARKAVPAKKTATKKTH